MKSNRFLALLLAATCLLCSCASNATVQPDENRSTEAVSGSVSGPVVAENTETGLVQEPTKPAVPDEPITPPATTSDANDPINVPDEHIKLPESDETIAPTDEPEPASVPEETNPSEQVAAVKFLTSGQFRSTRTVSGVSNEFKSHYTDFAMRLASLCQEKGGTLVSPLSVVTALLMTANGAKGTTLAQMMNTLFGSLSLEEANAQLFNYYAGLVNTADTSLEDANAVFFSDSGEFLVDPDFIELVKNTFDADVAKADFALPETVDLINSWCNKHTAGMIEKVLEYSDVSADTIMVLLNALCFMALWESQYEESQVREGVFHGLSGDQKVDLMYSEENGYISGEREEGFVKYYKGGNYAFVALLPEEGMDMTEYLASLENGRFQSLMESRKGAVNAAIPKFSFDLSKDLNDVLQAMGIEQAFTNASDLSGLGTLPNGGGLKISKVIHKTHIEVDPSGTKAAAVTAVIIKRVTSVGDKNPEVILDRPFVYAIVDTTSMLPIFIGTLTDVQP